MKRTILTATLALSLVSSIAIAHPTHSTASGEQTRQMGHGMMMGQATGMKEVPEQGHGMMAMHGRGMGMMGNMDQCPMENGMYGAGMMSGSHGMMDSALAEQRHAFLESSKELRKKIHDKTFEYMESSRNPEETIGSLRGKEKELSTLKQELINKRKEFFVQK